MVTRKGIYNTRSIKTGLMLLAGIGLLVMFMITALASDTDKDIGKVLRVVDGDTLIIQTSDNPDGIPMRLAGIDAPETYNNTKAKKAIISCGVHRDTMFSYGRIAKQHLTRTVLNRYIKYTVVDTGRFGRPIVYLPYITEDLIRSGLVAVVDYRNLPIDVYSRLHNLEITAKQQKSGLWYHMDLSCMNNRGRRNVNR